MKTRHVKLWVVAAALLLMSVSSVTAQTPEQREYALKAGFLYNFFSYVDWPQKVQQQNPEVFSIGIVGENPFGAAISSLQGKTVKGRRIEVKPITSSAQVEQVHMVFVTAGAEERSREILDKAKSSSVLTVGEASGFLRDGGVINLVSARNKVQIEINPEAAERAGLTISSQLLKLAKIVKE